MSLIVAGAAVCAAAAGSWIADTRQQRAHEGWCATATKAEGIVSRLADPGGAMSRNPVTDDDRAPGLPIVRFTAANGVEYEIDAPDAPRAVGATVAVAYDPALPSSARPVERVRKVGCSVAGAMIGISLMVAGVVR